MEAKIVNSSIYEQVTKNVANVFNKANFAELNREKVDDILYVVVYKEDSPRFGCIFCKIGNEWKCPFSAPYGYIEPLKKEQTVNNYEDALKAVEIIAANSGCKKISITLPPMFYDNNVINTWYALMLNSGWKELHVDINFALNIKDVINDYNKKIHYNARKNLRIASESKLKILECKTYAEKSEAYNIIKINRKSKGYPLKMSEEQVMRTITIVPAHLYIVSDEISNLASALIYDVTSDIAQVVYWGDVPNCQDKKVMNFLSYELLKIYANRDFSYLDIGPSTSEGIPNYGLCDFKDSIGCERAAKFWLYKELF